MKNTIINRKAVKKIALALDDLEHQVVFVGGALVSLYIDDKAAEDVRPTGDIDITLEISSLGKLEELREELNKRGFVQSSEDHVMCRFRYDDIKVDVMSTKEVGWAPANRWFAPGFESLIELEADGKRIQCLSLPYFLASKLTAFFDRGVKDARTSKDFEDIVYLLNHTSDIKEQILKSDNEVVQYIIECFNDILEDSSKKEAILGHLDYEDQKKRYDKILQLLNEVSNGI